MSDSPVLPDFTPATDVHARFIARGDGHYEPTIHVQGAWNDNEQHLAASIGLIVHALEQHEPRESMQIARITFEVYGFIPLRPTHVTVKTIRPGRTIELVQATFTVDGRTIIVANAWRLSAQDTSAVAGCNVEPMLSYNECEPEDMSAMWDGGFIASIRRRRNVALQAPGRSQSWVTSHVPLLEGEQASSLATFLSFIDTANGIAARENPREWMFPNVDLTLHLFREPVEGPTGLDTSVAFGETGLGVTMTSLNDVNGPIGRVAQSLTVRPMPAK